MPTQISWRVLATLRGRSQRHDLEHSEDASNLFNTLEMGLTDVNDRVVLFRLKKLTMSAGAIGPGKPSADEPWGTYQDPYKFTIMSPDGVLSRYAPYSPRTWQDAKRIIDKLRRQRRKR